MFTGQVFRTCAFVIPCKTLQIKCCLHCLSLASRIIQARHYFAVYNAHFKLYKLCMTLEQESVALNEQCKIMKLLKRHSLVCTCQWSSATNNISCFSCSVHHNTMQLKQLTKITKILLSYISFQWCFMYHYNGMGTIIQCSILTVKLPIFPYTCYNGWHAYRCIGLYNKLNREKYIPCTDLFAE